MEAYNQGELENINLVFLPYKHLLGTAIIKTTIHSAQ